MIPTERGYMTFILKPILLPLTGHNLSARLPQHEFSLERFFRWRCWWDYSTGLNGDLLTHEYDAINQILGLGIPGSVASSGGIYFFKDGEPFLMYYR